MVLNKNSQLKDLKEVLVSCGIDYSCWGKDSTKSLEQLFQEIQSGDCILHYSSDKIIRSVSVVTVDIFFEKNGSLYELFEEKQIFSNGSEKIRKLNSSLSEKIKYSESVEEALVRMVQEETGITIELSRFKIAILNRTDAKTSDSYPGVFSRYSFRDYYVFLNQDEYIASGYDEIQKDKTSYFKWREVSHA